ncbi:MAG: SUMF1/EgtB/PvdO family nonheme iron enzyme, partial [Candidatus Parabeggiatoa sp.]|nr:SUMF1/EgtB/PvdO family nonheme iron enzyme [Candidatus Parabeggiatoa sp.]
TIIGTLYYAPPEQLGHSEYGKPSAKSDLFSFGATLYRLMTGESPQNLNPRRLAEAPSALFELLCDCKEENPDRRPESVDSVVKRLEEINQKIGQQKRTKQPTPPNKKRSFPLKAFAVLGIVVLVAFAWFNLPKQADDPNPISKSSEEKETHESVVSEKTEISATVDDKTPESQQGDIEQKQAGDVFRDPLKGGGLGPEMVVIPAGTFRMGDIRGTGDNDEKPVHEVSVKQFAIGRYELTVAEFRQFVEATDYKTEAEKGDGCYVWKEAKWQEVKDANWRNPYFPQQDNQPVVCISWNDTKAYIDWLTEQTDQEYRLPSEAQWEYAARAGTETDYWWGNEIGLNRAVCEGCGSQWDDKQTAPVGSFEHNPFGLYDTAGNVWEWCADGWHENYEGAPTDGSVWEGDGSLFVLRGGSWFFVAVGVRSADRFRVRRAIRSRSYGARLARIL